MKKLLLIIVILILLLLILFFGSGICIKYSVDNIQKHYEELTSDENNNEDQKKQMELMSGYLEQNKMRYFIKDILYGNDNISVKFYLGPTVVYQFKEEDVD